MKGRFLTIVAALSLVLFIGAAAIWVRSYWWYDRADAPLTIARVSWMASGLAIVPGQRARCANPWIVSRRLYSSHVRPITNTSTTDSTSNSGACVCEYR